MKKALLVTIFMSLTVSSALSQADDKEDPFRNDPFFNKKIEDLLHKNTTQDSVINDSSGNSDFNLRYINNNGIDLGGALEAGPYTSNPLYSVYPNLPMIHFNRVNGLFLGIRKERMQWLDDDSFLGISDFRTHWMAGYSTGQNEFQYNVGLERYFGFKDHFIIGAEFHNAATTDDQWRAGLTETSITSFIGGWDFLDYYKQKGFGTYLIFRTARFLEGGIAYGNDRFNSLEREVDWALFGTGNRLRRNPPVEMISANGNGVADSLNISNLVFSGSFNPKNLLLTRHFSLSFTGTVELAGPGLGESDFSYNKYLGELKTFINFEPGGVLKNRIRIGAITGDAPLFKEFELGGIGSLRALPFKSLGPGNQMLLSNTELQFGSPGWGPENDWIDFDDFFLTFFLDSGWSTFSDRLTNSDNLFNAFSDFQFKDLSHNGGVGVGSNSFRFELAWDLDNTSRSPVLWLRFNPTF